MAPLGPMPAAAFPSLSDGPTAGSPDRADAARPPAWASWTTNRPPWAWTHRASLATPASMAGVCTPIWPPPAWPRFST